MSILMIKAIINLDIQKSFMSRSIGDKVTLKVLQPYLKTSDPMPMLRPPDLVAFDEIGEILALLPKGMVEVKFRKGAFILNIDDLVPAIPLA